MSKMKEVHDAHNRKCDAVTVMINDESVIANIIDKNEFIKRFFELVGETLMKSDDRQYWVLCEMYWVDDETYSETYWCISALELDFMYDEQGWQYVHNGFEQTSWTVKCNGYEYYAIGYESRGIFKVPIACIINDSCVSCTVYEIIKGFKTVTTNDNISATRLNSTEIELLEKVGCKWTGCFITAQ